MIVKEEVLKQSGVCVSQGFYASGIHAGLKKAKKDVAVIFSDEPCVAAGVFTRNKVKAAPVLLNMEHLEKSSGRARAIIVNSANANACTGERGLHDALEMAKTGAKLLDIPVEEVLVSSTGVIGVPLPLDKVKTGIKEACATLSRGGSLPAAQAIMTTDLVPKEDAVTIEVGGKRVAIGGIAKGSGMIHPNMATMLSFITTDAAISQSMLKGALKEAADLTFNMISVDGDTSTNDMVLILANGKAKNSPIEEEGRDYEEFKAGLIRVCESLAKKIAADGEGATKLFEVEVKNAKTPEDARKAARKVTESNLVKTAIFGEDANWGRIIMAVGNSGAEFNPDRVDVFLESAKGREQMMASGQGLHFSEERALEILQEKEIRVIVDLKDGVYSAKAWGCDFSYDYVKINAEYRS